MGLSATHLLFLASAFAAVGKPLRDGLHVIALNNHGVNRYITESQSLNLDLTLGAAVVMVIVFFGLILAHFRSTRR